MLERVEQPVGRGHEQRVALSGGSQVTVVLQAPAFTAAQGGEHQRGERSHQEHHHHRGPEQHRHVGAPRSRNGAGGAVDGHGRASYPCGQDEQPGDHQHLQHRQRGGAGQVELLRGEQVDLGLDVGVAQAAHREHDAEGRGTEEEDDAGRRHDPGQQRRQRHRAQHLPRVRTECGCGLLATGVDRLPEGADRAYDDTDVEEHQGRHDRRRRTVQTECAERPGRCDQLAEGNAHHHGRQHEGHHHQRTEQVATREPQPVQGERDRDPHHHGHQRRARGRPEGEPQDPMHPGPAEHLEHRTWREGAIGPEPADEHPGDRVQEEQHECGQRHRGQGHGAQPAGWCVEPSRDRSLAGDVPPLSQPLGAVRGDLPRVDRVGLRRRLCVLRPRLR